MPSVLEATEVLLEQRYLFFDDFTDAFDPNSYLFIRYFQSLFIFIEYRMVN